MIRIPRTIVIIGTLFLITVLGALLAVNLWLTSWVPAKGKVWLETQLNQHLPLRVTIGTMRYSVWQGFLLDEVRAVDPAAGTTWVETPHLQARLGFLRFLLQRQVAFRMKTALTAPCETVLIVSGRYGLATRHLIVDLLTSDTSIEGLIPEAAAFLPNLKGGRARLKLRVNWQPTHAPVFTGRLIGIALVWEQTALRITSDVSVEGTVTPTTLPAPKAGQRAGQASRQAGDPAAPWTVNVKVDVERGSLEGPHPFNTVQHVAGTLRMSHDTVTIERLQGAALDSPWEMNGTVTHLLHPDLNLVFRMRAALKHVAAQLGRFEQWQPVGEAVTVVTCRGPLAQWPELDCRAEATLQDASVVLTPLFRRSSQRLERVTGALQYEHLARGLTIETLSGQIQGHPVTARGSVQFHTPATMNLVVEAEADLALAKESLPADSPVQTLAGPVSLQMELGGLLTHPTWKGVAALREAMIGLRAWPSSVERLSGTIRFTDQEVSTPQLTCVLAGQPVTISGTVTAFATTPRFVGQVGVADHRLALDVTARPDQFALQTVELAIGASRLRVKGQISRLRGQPSQLTASGTVRLTDLSEVPWMDASALAPWQLEGDVAVQARLSGPLDEPRALSVLGVIQSEQLMIKGVPVRAVTAEVEQGLKQWSLRLTNASIAAGKLTGGCLLERSEPARYMLEGDLTLVDLQQLAASIPAWRGRDLQGTLSAHTSVVGVWKDRSKMQGDGWLHAEGARLGEVPLLEGVFRGVFGALAERLGLIALRKAQIVKVAGQWRLAQERVWTEDLRVTGLSGTDPVALVVRGSVGLDKTLDLVVEPELSEQLLTQAPNTSALAGTILKVMGGLERARGLVGRHHISGTIDKPQYKFEVSLDQLLNQTLPAGLGQLLDSLR